MGGVQIEIRHRIKLDGKAMHEQFFFESNILDDQHEDHRHLF
jgi:hypothetical protein